MFRRAIQYAPRDLGYRVGELADHNPNAAPMIALMLYANRRRAENVELANDYIGEALMSLIEPVGLRIIDEIRQARGALVGFENVPTDPRLTPTYPGVDLRQILYNDASGLEGINEKLQALLDRGASEEDIEAAIENIRLIAIVLGAL